MESGISSGTSTGRGDAARQSSESSSKERPGSESILWGAFIGASAFLTGWAATSVFLRFWDAPWVVVGGVSGQPLEQTGTLFFNAHTVPIRDASAGFGPAEFGFGLLSAFSELVLAFYALPVLLLAVGGFVLARRSTAQTRAERCFAGALVVVGYFPLALVGMVAVGSTGSFNSPNAAHALLVAATAYPIAFGTIGGLLAHLSA